MSDDYLGGEVVSEDNEGFEDVDFEEQSDDGFDDGNDYSDVDDSGEEDPWEWARELEPDKVKKTWTQYTQTREELKNQEREYQKKMAEVEPFIKLREEILADPGLVNVIEDYLANAKPQDREVFQVKQEVQALKAQMQTEMELEKLDSWIRSNKYPKVTKEEILRYAVENQIPNLQVAYKDMFFDELRESRVKEVTDGIKRSKGAASIPRRSKVPTKRQTGYTQADWKNMSDEEFYDNYKAYIANL